MSLRSEFLKKPIRRVVLKVGSSLLSETDGQRKRMLQLLRQEILAIRRRGIEAILVSSGAVSTGRHAIQNRFQIQPQRNPSLSRRQALSAIGQHRLMADYDRVFLDAGVPVAQMLITARDFRDRRAYLNIGHTIQELMQIGALPIVNENDTVATDELQFGENDILSAACAALFRADLLVILTSVEGFLFEGERLRETDRITQALRKAAGGPDGPGRGGMQTKLRAGELCLISGNSLAILPGHHASPLTSFLAGEDIGTLICRSGEDDRPRLRARKRWLLFAASRGGVVIDAGAGRALKERGSSLLPAGVRSTYGSFISGDVIEIRSEQDEPLGRGIANYSQPEIGRMLGLTGREIQARGLATRGIELIHRDDLAIEY